MHERELKTSPEISMKQRLLTGFGQRLAHIRKEQGITQDELGKNVGVSNRVIAYYEQDSAQPPGPILIHLAKALEVSTDELLGIKPVKTKAPAHNARLLKRLQRVEELPPADRRSVFKYLDALLTRTRAKAQDKGVSTIQANRIAVSEVRAARKERAKVAR
jgi:transcriptional regulator with XRE-family HTH domain